MATVTELVTEFKFQGSTSPLNKYNASLGKGIGLLAGMTAALAASGAAVSKWASNVLQAFDSTAQLSRQTGVAVEWIQEMGYVASMNGGSVEGLATTVDGLSQKIGEAAQKGSEDFARLGISVRDASGRVKNADVVLGEVRQSFQRLGLSMSEQRSFAETLGIDSSLIQTLNLTNAEMAELRENARGLGILTTEQADEAVRYNDSLTTLRFGLDGLQRLIAVGLAPQLEAIAEWFTDLLKNNREWIIDGVKHGMGVLSDFLAMLKRVYPVLGLMAAGFVVMKIATLGFAGALGVLFSPAVLIAAGIAAVLLVVDDLIVAFKGGDSVIRDFFLTFFDFDIQPVLKDIVSGFLEMYSVLMDLAKAYFKGVVGIFSAIGDLLDGNFSKAFEGLKDAFKTILSGLGRYFKALFGGVLEWVKGKVSGLIPDFVGIFSAIGDLLDGNFSKAFGGLKDAFKTILSGLGRYFKALFGGVLEWVKGKVSGLIPDWMIKFLGVGDGDAAAAQPSSDPSFAPGGSQTVQNGGNSNVEQTVNMEIRTGDPEKAGRTAADSLQRQMADAQVQAKRGGL